MLQTARLSQRTDESEENIDRQLDNSVTAQASIHAEEVSAWASPAGRLRADQRAA